MSDSRNQLMPLSLSAPGVNLGAYISTVNQIPILTAEQEKSWPNAITTTKTWTQQKCWSCLICVSWYILHVVMQVMACLKVT